MPAVRFSLTFSLLLALALPGCALLDPGGSYGTVAQGAPPIAAGQARLVVYRPTATHLLGVVPSRHIEINGAPVCALANDDFFVHDVAAGPITITDGGSILGFRAEPGLQYFVRVAFNKRRASIVGWVPPVLGFEPDQKTSDSGLFAIDPVDRTMASTELAKLTLAAGCH
jgi:hypothetical protein